ncbi:MAG: DUF4190 domain-containing protein [Microbacterium sp.]
MPPTSDVPVDEPELDEIPVDEPELDEVPPANLAGDLHTTATSVETDPPEAEEVVDDVVDDEPVSVLEAQGVPPAPPGPGFVAGQVYTPAPEFSPAPGTAGPFVPAPVVEPALHAPARKALALTALIVGIVAFLAGWVPFLGVALGLTAVVFGIVALVRRQSKGLAITGLALGAVAVVFSTIMSIAAIAVAANYDAFVEGFEEGLGGTGQSQEPTEATDDGSADEAEALPELTDFAALDDAGFAALLADPNGHAGETYVLYGEVQQLDENTGACSALVTIDDGQQASWEGYAVTAWAFAESGDTVCPEFDALGELSHVKAWITVLGTTSTEFDDGTVEDLLTLSVRQVETLPALP